MKKMFAVLEVLKEHGPMSSPQLGAKMGVTRECARSHINYLREQSPKLVYIHSWTPGLGYGRGRSGPLFAAGDAEDVAQPLVRVRIRNSSPGTRDSEDGEVRMHNEMLKRAEQIQPFRDPMLFRTAGRRP